MADQKLAPNAAENRGLKRLYVDQGDGTFAEKVVATFEGGEQQTAPARLFPKGYQKRTVSNASVGFTSVPAGAAYATIQVEGADVRYRDDGSAPTATDGLLLYDGSTFQVAVQDLAAVRFIRAASTDATLHTLFYGVS